MLNHSTHCAGLLPVLNRLATLLPEGSIIIPGFISRCRPSSFRGFRLRLQASPSISGAYRLVARRGTTVQEVMVKTHAEREQLQAATATAVEGSK